MIALYQRGCICRRNSLLNRSGDAQCGWACVQRVLVMEAFWSGSKHGRIPRRVRVSHAFFNPRFLAGLLARATFGPIF